MARVSCITCGLIVCISTVVCGLSDTLQSEVRRAYIQELLHTLGDGSSISQANITNYMDKTTIWKSNDQLSNCLLNISGTIHFEQQCLIKLCLSPEEVYEVSGLDHGNSEERLSTLSTILLLLSENKDCRGMSYVVEEDHHHGNTTHIPPPIASVWGFGILCTTLINLCSLTGVILLPFIHGAVYKGMLIYMVGLAVGTLCGSSVLFLIPEALELTDQELNIDSYIWKSSTVIIGIYSFFLIERIMKMITLRHEKRKVSKLKARQRIHRDSAMSFASFHKGKEIPEYRKTNELSALPCCNNESNSSIEEGSLSDQEQDISRKESGATLDNKDNISNATRKPLVPKNHNQVAPVAYMIIFGDGLHNFIDGVSIGAAFTESILAGVSVSIAILCEEFPHELGDFAVLLNAGMKIKRAVLYNFLSATMCYLGLVVGIFLGENTSTHTWVFAFAGGMFLYISLVDMMPEMNGAAEDEENKEAIGTRGIFLLQNFGLITGFALMMLMAIYGGHLEEAINGH